MGRLVSVIIPTFNRAHCLARSIDSALGQSHGEIEVIVLDDGSTDGTADLMASCYGRDRRVVYRRQDNAGVVAARNAALALSNGDFVAFLDSDDIWLPWKVEAQLAALRAAPDAGMVWTDMQALDPQGGIAHDKYLRRMYSAYRWFPGPADLFQRSCALPGPQGQAITAHVGDIYSALITGNLVHTSTVLLTRERLGKVGGFDPRFAVSGEDYDFHLRTCREGPVMFLDVASVRYQVGMADQLTRKSAVIAQNFLATIEDALARDSARITLPRPMLDATFAHAHGWIAELMIAQGDRVGGRRHYLRSLRHQPWQPRAFAQLALCSLPHGLDDRLRAAYRRLMHAELPQC
jgi:GT2 family glycosyltransferase